MKFLPDRNKATSIAQKNFPYSWTGANKSVYVGKKRLFK